MKSETVPLLCSPGTHEPLRLENVQNLDGSPKSVLVGIHSGEKFTIRDGIPLLLDEAKITGYNHQYQGNYNRVAGFYDAGIRMFATLAGKGEANFRKEYLQELDVRDGDRLLEVSIGTGANLHFLPGKADCFGLDISWGMLKRCQKNLRRWGLKAELILGNAL